MAALRALQAPHLADPSLSEAMAGNGGYMPSGLKIIPPQLGPVGYGAMWAAFVAFVLTTVYFLRASMASHSKASRIYHYIMLCCTFTCACSYLTMITGFMLSKPFGPHFDFVWVHYATWTIKTPMLLTVLGMLSNMHSAEIYMMVAFDLLMIASGYGSQLATHPEAIWPLFTFGCVCQLLVFVVLMTHLRAIAIEHDEKPESKAFTWLSWYVFVVWNFITAIMVCDKLGVISYDGLSVGYAVGEMLATIVFGFVVVGTREALEGNNTPVALIAMSWVGIDPEHREGAVEQRRRNSIDVTALEEIRALYHNKAGGETSGAGAGYNNPNSAIVQQMATMQAQALGVQANPAFAYAAAMRNGNRGLGAPVMQSQVQAPAMSQAQQAQAQAQTLPQPQVDAATLAMLAQLMSNPQMAAALAASGVGGEQAQVQVGGY